MATPPRCRTARIVVARRRGIVYTSENGILSAADAADELLLDGDGGETRCECGRDPRCYNRETANRVPTCGRLELHPGETLTMFHGMRWLLAPAVLVAWLATAGAVSADPVAPPGI